MALLFECPEHRDAWQEWITLNIQPSCPDCRRIVAMAKKNEEVSARHADRPHRKLDGRFSVANVPFDGRVIENLTPRPTFVRNKDEYRTLLIATGSQEAG